MLIYNENAGNGKLERNLEGCLPVIAPHIDEFLILQTKEKGDACRFCLEFGEDMDVVFVLGGDGTVHECINGLSPLRRRPLFGILPGGTCNDFSRTLKIPQNVRQAAEALMARFVQLILDRPITTIFPIFGEWGLFQMHQAILMSRKKAGSER
ncbi:diacylglycerol kinase family protein [Peribacillus sp. V2I11]|uniref:diacylglycerol kinase family protein n=1 Tax=Peribacillus sp. V2I11 TaxID=3042277 RepID=UPI002787CC0D|nr:diacylglycerol kinase family protein [Peribacillus sp. V2I11]MDQ0881008.1 YegS/Rv2252/BmrU family lipid kinase [Peribacillus sp. V2I11]